MICYQCLSFLLWKLIGLNHKIPYKDDWNVIWGEGVGAPRVSAHESVFKDSHFPPPYPHEDKNIIQD